MPNLGELIPSDCLVEGAVDFTITGLTPDSRAVERGFVFAAIRGTQVDGAKFIPKAIEQGAIAILLDEETPCDAQVTIIRSPNPRKSLAEMAASFFPKQPSVIAAVTGTAGKSSVVSFLRQIWEHAGFEAASIGTVGIVSSKSSTYGGLTTPDAVKLHETIQNLAEEGVTHLAFEASSHGLDQYRLDGVKVTHAAFTNLGRDHMDYHPDIDDYMRAKMRLFRDLLPVGAPAVIDENAPFGAAAQTQIEDARRVAWGVGKTGTKIRLMDVARSGFGQNLVLAIDGVDHSVFLPLLGDFQVSNALTAAGLALASGVEVEAIIEALADLKGEKGRLEYVGQNNAGALFFIDYAHKVEALQNILEALRPYAENQLIVVFGAGGDRDNGKRPLMGKAACEGSDLVIVTDDNPRSEDPALIRGQILVEVPDALEIGDREEAINEAVKRAKSGDVVVIAGKGHETGQIVGDKILPFSDHEVLARALNDEG